jgi:hypothetical protein
VGSVHKRASGGPWAFMMLQRHNYSIVIVNQLHPTAKSATQEHVCISEIGHHCEVSPAILSWLTPI